MLAMVAKVVVAPLVVWLGSTLGLLHFASWAQIIGVGVLIALASMLADGTILPRSGNLPSTLLDWLVGTVVLWASGRVLAGAVTPFVGSLITGGILAITEWLTHPAILSPRRQA